MGSNEKIVVFGPALPSISAPMWVAYDKGFFKEEGLGCRSETGARHSTASTRAISGAKRERSFSNRPAARRRFAQCWKSAITSTARST